MYTIFTIMHKYPRVAHMCTCMYKYINIYIYIYYTYIYTQAYINMGRLCTNIYIYIYIYMYVNVHKCPQIRMNACRYIQISPSVPTYPHMCAYMCVYAYKYINI